MRVTMPMDAVFKALADPSRRQLLDRLNARSGQSLRELCNGLSMARQSVTKHLAVLEAAGVVTTSRRGREKLHFLNAAPINDIAERWMDRYDRARAEALADLKRGLEDRPMSETEFVYTTYIATTPERLWQALTDPAFTRRYWGPSFTPIGGSAPRCCGRKASTRSRATSARSSLRLNLSGGCPTPGTTRGPTTRRCSAGPRSAWPRRSASRARATFDLEPADDAVKLTATHDGFASEARCSTPSAQPGHSCSPTSKPCSRRATP